MTSKEKYSPLAEQPDTPTVVPPCRTFRRHQLPPAESCRRPHSLIGHTVAVQRLVVLPDGVRFAIGSVDGHVRVFALDDGESAITDISAHEKSVQGLASLGDDVLVSGGSCEKELATWSASTGAKLSSVDARGLIIQAIVALDSARFVLASKRFGQQAAVVVFFAHTAGRLLHEETCIEAAHGQSITDLAVYGDKLYTVSDDRTAGVWSTVTRERLATLRGHTERVCSVDASEKWIATGSSDGSVRVYHNAGEHAPVACLKGLHEKAIFSLSILGESLLMTGSRDSTLCFTALSSDVVPTARVQCSAPVAAARVLPDARLLVELENAVVIEPPPGVAEHVGMHAAALYSSETARTKSPVQRTTLREALTRVCAGELAPDVACRQLIRKEDTPRSIEEWWYGHLLLMEAVRHGVIPASVDFDGNQNHWFEHLYALNAPLEMGCADYGHVKECLNDAERVGVLSSGTALALAAVIGTEDLPDDVHKLQDANRGMLVVLSRILLDQAALDGDLRRLGSAVDRQTAIDNISTILNAFRSLGPRALPSSSIPRVRDAGSGSEDGLVFGGAYFLESLLRVGRATHGSRMPSLVGRFVSGVEELLSPSEKIPLDIRERVGCAVEGLGMRRKDFIDMVKKANSREREQAKMNSASNADAVEALERYESLEENRNMARVHDSKKLRMLHLVRGMGSQERNMTETANELRSLRDGAQPGMEEARKKSVSMAEADSPGVEDGETDSCPVLGARSSNATVGQDSTGSRGIDRGVGQAESKEVVRALKHGEDPASTDCDERNTRTRGRMSDSNSVSVTTEASSLETGSRRSDRSDAIALAEYTPSSEQVGADLSSALNSGVRIGEQENVEDIADPQTFLKDVVDQVTGGEFPFLLEELEEIYGSSSNLERIESRWPLHRLFEERGASLVCLSRPCEELPSSRPGQASSAHSEPDWLKGLDVELVFVVYSDRGAKFALLLDGRPLSLCGLKLFLALVPPTARAVCALQQIGSLRRNCLLEELGVPCEGRAVNLKIKTGWLCHLKKQKPFLDEHCIRFEGDSVVVGSLKDSLVTSSPGGVSCSALRRRLP